MPRPKKEPGLLKAETLRIPVSATEKMLIVKAAVAVDGEFARWARSILLRAAEEFRGQSKDGITPRARKNGTSRRGSDPALE
jgi:hypothetical protein